MRKWIALFLSFVLVLGLDACGNQTSELDGTDQGSQTGSENAEQESQTTPEDMEQESQITPEDAEMNNDLPDDGVESNASSGITGTGSIVYMTTDISPEGLMAVYEALGWTPEGRVAVKLSTGEPPASNYLHPELIADVVEAVNGTIVECNTAYGSSRAETAMHYQVSEDHGFTAIADFQILDENGSMSLPVTGGTHLTENFVGAAFADYDSYLILSHFKGHAMAGFGGAIKNSCCFVFPERYPG